MIILKYILFIYAIFGFLVAGGFLFNKTNRANIYLGFYSLIFSFGQIDFLYNSTRIGIDYPQFKSLFLSFWMLLGPFIWFYIKYFDNTNKHRWRIEILHFIPALFYLSFTIYMMIYYTGKERLIYFWKNFNTVIMPINYGIAIHLSSYAVLMIVFVKKNLNRWSNEKRLYIISIVSIYIFTAVVESYLTVYAESYQWFIYYFLITSSIVFFVAYILYFKPQILKTISKKYYSSGLDKNGKLRISSKMDNFLTIDENIINSKLNLQYLSVAIGEKKHNISQTISEEFNTTFNEMVNKKRIEYAQKLLSDRKNDNLKLFAIALDSGFTNKTTFHRAFVKYTHMTPNEFRKNSVI